MSDERDTVEPPVGLGYPLEWDTPAMVLRELVEVQRERLKEERHIGAILCDIRDVLRGRDGNGDIVKSPLAAIVKLLGEQRTGPAAVPASAPQSAGKRVAPASELDGQYGNPKARFDPKRWKGASYKGQTFSACDPAFLDEYADALDWFGAEAQKKVDAGGADENTQKNAKFNPIDAARARGWAARLRAGGYKPPPVTAPPPDDYD